MKAHSFLFLLCTLPLAAKEEALDLDPARTAITFTLGDVLHTVHGSFKLKRGALQFDPDTGKATGEIVVDVASGNSGGGARDRRMHKEILETSRYPEAVFTPDHITGQFSPQGESQLEAHGIFQIHGTSHEVTLHFVVQVIGDELTATTHFVIPYVQWGMKNPSNFLLRVSDKIELSIETSGHLKSQALTTALNAHR